MSKPIFCNLMRKRLTVARRLLTALSAGTNRCKNQCTRGTCQQANKKWESPVFSDEDFIIHFHHIIFFAILAFPEEKLLHKRIRPSFLPLHPIPVAVARMHPPPHLRQQAAERGTRAILQRRGVLFLQDGVDIRRRHQTRALFARFRQLKATADEFFGGRHAVERAVRRLDFRLLRLAEPATLAVLQFM